MSEPASGPGLFVTDINTHVTVVNSWNSYGGLGLVTHLVGLIFLISLAPTRFHRCSHPLDAFYKAEMCWQHSTAWFLACALYAIAGPLLVDDMLNQSSQNTTALYVSLFFLTYLASFVWWLISMHFMIWNRTSTRFFLITAGISVTLLVIWCFVIINKTHPAHTVVVCFMYLPIGLAWFATDHCYGFRDTIPAKQAVTAVVIEHPPSDVWNSQDTETKHSVAHSSVSFEHHHHRSNQTAVEKYEGFDNSDDDSWAEFLKD